MKEEFGDAILITFSHLGLEMRTLVHLSAI